MKNIRNLFCKEKKAARIFFVSFIVMSASFILLIIAQFTAINIGGFKSGVYRINTSLPIKKYIKIEVGNIPLKVNTYNGSEIKISYVNETDLIINETSYELTLKQDPDFSFSLFTADLFNYGLEILLPDKIYNSITINSTSGAVNLGYLYTHELSVTGRSAPISINDTGGKIFVQNKSGKINISFLDLTDLVSIMTESGNITVEMPVNESPHLSFITESGTFTSDFFRFRYKDYQGDIYSQMGNNPKPFNVTTKTGNLTFLKRIFDE